MNEGKMFGSQGTPEQIKDAQGSMTKSQEKATAQRNLGLAVLEKINPAIVNEILNLEKSSIGEHESDVSLKGVINGHEIIIQHGENSAPCAIDGKEVPGKLGKELQEKIIHVYFSLKNTPDYSEAIKKELAEFSDVEVIASDLLKKL